MGCSRKIIAKNPRTSLYSRFLKKRRMGCVNPASTPHSCRGDGHPASAHLWCAADRATDQKPNRSQTNISPPGYLIRSPKPISKTWRCHQVLLSRPPVPSSCPVFLSRCSVRTKASKTRYRICPDCQKLSRSPKILMTPITVPRFRCGKAALPCNPTLFDCLC